MKKHLVRWAAVYLLVAFFLGSWVLQGYFQWQEFVSNAEDHKQAATLADFWPEFLAATFENWQSEFLQLAVQCVLVQSLWANRHMFAADGAADKDDVERILRAIEEKG